MLVRVSPTGRRHGAVVASIVAYLFASLSSRASIVDQGSLSLGLRYAELRRLSYDETFVLAAFPDLELATDVFLLPRPGTLP